MRVDDVLLSRPQYKLHPKGQCRGARQVQYHSVEWHTGVGHTKLSVPIVPKAKGW